MSTSPSAAACSSRAATLTASPVASFWSAAPSPTITSPVLTPVRVAIRMPYSRARSSFTRSRASRISNAARTARSASSSWTAGTPNTATIASPMNFSTVPPCRSSVACIASKYRHITRRSDSGSSRSPSAVEPTTSVKTTVTTFRVSASLGWASSRSPQASQNRASASFSRPQEPQTMSADPTPKARQSAEEAERATACGRGRRVAAGQRRVGDVGRRSPDRAHGLTPSRGAPDEGDAARERLARGVRVSRAAIANPP